MEREAETLDPIAVEYLRLFVASGGPGTLERYEAAVQEDDVLSEGARRLAIAAIAEVRRRPPPGARREPPELSEIYAATKIADMERQTKVRKEPVDELAARRRELGAASRPPMPEDVDPVVLMLAKRLAHAREELTAACSAAGTTGSALEDTTALLAFVDAAVRSGSEPLLRAADAAVIKFRNASLPG